MYGEMGTGRSNKTAGVIGEMVPINRETEVDMGEGDISTSVVLC